jgi:hypothetical protein
MPLESRDSSSLVLSHQAAIPGNICYQDGGEPTLDVGLVRVAPRPKPDFSMAKMLKYVCLGVHE